MPGPRTAAALLVAAGLAASGCFQAYNPTSFPNWGYGGEITETHAKPSGGAYFKNFDPEVCRIRLTPLKCDNPVGKQQVLVASVVDADGQPRRSRRVEWILDGPGFIVEVDESGWYSARGYKVDNKYAVSHTDYKPHTITRGNDDPRDDFTIHPGQTWCVVSSAVEGETTVTAYAPGVHNWEHGRVTARLRWGPTLPAGDAFGPAPAGAPLPPPSPAFPTVSRAGPAEPELSLTLHAPKVAAVGKDVPLAVMLANPGKADSPAVTVRAAVPDGATLVKADPPPTKQSGKDLTWDAGVVKAGDKKPFQLTVRASKPGTLTLTASAETPDGAKAEQSAGVPVDVAGLKLALDVPPKATAAGGVPVKVSVTNTGAVPTEGVTVWVAADEGLAGPDDPNPNELTLGTISAGQTKTVDVRFAPPKSGTFGVRANVTADGGLADKAEAKVEVRRAEAKIAVAGPATAPLGQEAEWDVRVTNTGDDPLTDATVRVNLPAGLTAVAASDGGKAAGAAATWRLASVAAGGKATLRVTATADREVDNVPIVATVSAAALAKPVSTEAGISVAGTASLAVELPSPPGLVPVGRRKMVSVTVRNTGNGPAKRVELTLTGSPELTLRGGESPDGRAAQSADGRVVFPPLAELPAGKTATFQVDVEASKPGNARLGAEVKADHLPRPVRDEQTARVVP